MPLQMLLMLMITPLVMTLSLLLFLTNTFISIEFPLMISSSFMAPVSILLDWFSTFFLSVVMMISSMILLYSTSYIPPQEHQKFSVLLLAFVLSMGILILSDNLLFMLLGWDGLGLTSYALVIYYQNPSSAASGSITILSNRIGDILILISIGLMVSGANWNFSFNQNFPLFPMIFLLLAACSKSAQFPFSAWLPAAMAAPTPISALVHSSTLVTAGVYLLMRVMNNPHPSSMALLLTLASCTAIYASMSAIWEQDMKKIIALSTLSQIAMMMFAISMGMIYLAFSHLIIHAMFKSMMFLCAGSLIHSSSYQDMRMMGSIFYASPIIPSALGVSITALIALPFTSGFFSKDPMMEMMLESHPLKLLTMLMIISIGMTAVYSLRMITLSLKFLLKTKPDVTLHPDNFLEAPVIVMMTFSIVLGALISWISPPEQAIILPFTMKILILISLGGGSIMAMSMSFRSPRYNKTGEPSISLWFIHFMSSNLFAPTFSKMSLLSVNDKSWQEKYGPSMVHSILLNSSLPSNKTMSPPMYILTLTILAPAIMLLL